MTIRRVINDSSVEIELDDRELYEAYLEKQAKFDEDDIRDVFYGFSDDELEEMYGRTRQEIEKKIPDIASEMRRNIDRYDMQWQYARDVAIEELLLM